MKAFKIIMNILGIIAASFLSILLVFSLIAVPVVSAVSSFFKADSIHTILANVDYSQIITSEMGDMDEDEIPAIGNDLMNQLMETEMMKEIVELCVDNIFAVIDGKEDKSLTAEDIQFVAEKHMDELVVILRGYIGDKIELSDDTLESMARDFLKEYSGMIAELLPSLKDLGIDSELLSVIRNLRNGTYFWVVFGIAGILTVLVMLCQVMRFKGFMWIGVNYLVAAIFTLIASFAIKAFDLGTLLMDDSIAMAIVSPMIGIVSTEMTKGAGIMALLGVVFIVVFALGRKLLKKQKSDIESEFAGA